LYGDGAKGQGRRSTDYNNHNSTEWPAGLGHYITKTDQQNVYYFI
jgi:hypothetical protein